MLGLLKRMRRTDCGFGFAAWNYYYFWEEETEKMLSASLGPAARFACLGEKNLSRLFGLMDIMLLRASLTVE